MALIDSDLVVSTSFGALLLVGLRSGEDHLMDHWALPFEKLNKLNNHSENSRSTGRIKCTLRHHATVLLIFEYFFETTTVRNSCWCRACPRHETTRAARVISRFDSHSGMLSDLDLSMPIPKRKRAPPSSSQPPDSQCKSSMLPDACVKLWDLSTPSKVISCVTSLIQDAILWGTDSTKTFGQSVEFSDTQALAIAGLTQFFSDPEQIIDSVDIFFIEERQWKLSLRFLAWSLLRSDIQQDTHDSIEDARAALLLYKKYLALAKEGAFEQVLDAIYEDGRKYNFKPPQKLK
ncbi:poly(A)-specific ribonuclease [Chytriomyces hyalinus]|nr:poly(A)-specific ribonuclease [Chytriomyces hyalinus]